MGFLPAEAVSGGGGNPVVSEQYEEDNTNINVNSTIGANNNVPQRTSSGTEIHAFDPVALEDATNRLRISGQVYMGSNSFMSIHLFADDQDDAIACLYCGNVSSSASEVAQFEAIISPGDLTSRTYSIRAGRSIAGSMYTNANSSNSPRFGTVVKTWYRMEEIPAEVS